MSAPRVCGKPTRTGEPCGQVLGAGERECIWHGTQATPEARSAIARLGGLRMLRTLPADAPVPSFNTREEIVEYAETQAHLVATGQLDARLSTEMRGWADLAMKAHELSALDRLARLEKVVKGKRIA
jgi:hypothetical protein